MAAAPIEFRYYLRAYTIADAEANVPPNRQWVGDAYTGKMKVFAPPALQWRARERVANGDGAVSMEWGDWKDVNYFREGDDAPTEPSKAA